MNRQQQVQILALLNAIHWNTQESVPVNKVIKNWVAKQNTPDTISSYHKKGRQGGKYAQYLSKLRVGDSCIFGASIDVVCPSITNFKNRYGGKFKSRTVGKNSVEVTRIL